MVGISASIPTIAQAIQSLNNPQVPNVNVGTANPDANSGAISTSSAIPISGGVVTGGSVDTYA